MCSRCKQKHHHRTECDSERKLAVWYGGPGHSVAEVKCCSVNDTNVGEQKMQQQKSKVIRE